jgi:hypothetical protein
VTVRSQVVAALHADYQVVLEDSRKPVAIICCFELFGVAIPGESSTGGVSACGKASNACEPRYEQEHASSPESELFDRRDNSREDEGFKNQEVCWR